MNAVGASPVIAEWVGSNLVWPNLYDTFSRISTNAWGTSDSGHTWAPATSNTLLTTGTEGRMTFTPPGSGQNQISSVISNEQFSDAIFTFRFRINQVPESANIGIRPFARSQLNTGTSHGNAYLYQASIPVNGQVSASINRWTGVSTTIKNGVVVLDAGSVGAGDWIWLKVKAEGWLFSMKAWKDGTTEPAVWQEGTDNDSGNGYSVGWWGINIIRSATVTNTGMYVEYDHLSLEAI